MFTIQHALSYLIHKTHNKFIPANDPSFTLKVNGEPTITGGRFVITFIVIVAVDVRLPSSTSASRVYTDVANVVAAVIALFAIAKSALPVPVLNINLFLIIFIIVCTHYDSCT